MSRRETKIDMSYIRPTITSTIKSTKGGSKNALKTLRPQSESTMTGSKMAQKSKNTKQSKINNEGAQQSMMKSTMSSRVPRSVIPKQKKKKNQKMMVSFKQYRDIQKIREQEHLGPGSTDCQIPFGSDNPRRMPFGEPHRHKINETPPPGIYQSYMQGSSSKMSTIDFGSKYKFVPNKNPAPGQYQPDDSLVRSRTPTLNMSRGCKSSRATYLKSTNIENPSPDKYKNVNPKLGDFKNSRSFVIGKRPKWQPGNQSTPGRYNAEAAHDFTKPKIRGPVMRDDRQIEIDVTC